MKIALIGYGKMGKLIGEIALQNEHQIVAKIDPHLPSHRITKEAVADADICIDFSHPNAVLENIKTLGELNKNIIVGTTGWYDQIDTVRRYVELYKIGLLYSPNFSIGVNLFLRIVKEAAALIDHFDEYDVGGYEVHHNQKADSPSGTAKAIVSQLLDQVRRKKTAVYEKVDRPPTPDELHFASLRSGSNPGFHSVIFDSAADTLTLSHQARNREGFARGAVAAAEWLQNKKGLFTMQDIL